MIQIDVCVDKSKSTTEKDRVLEHLVAKLLEVQQYEVVETIRVTGMEIDVFAKHKVNNASLLVECKAWETPLPADVIMKLMGNVYLRNVDQGWLVSTGTLSKDALGIKVEWESRIDSERKKFSFYTYDRVIEQLIASGIIVPSQGIINEIKNETVAENIVLMLTDIKKVVYSCF
jgi:Restriction endonuclease.